MQSAPKRTITRRNFTIQVMEPRATKPKEMPTWEARWAGRLVTVSEIKSTVKGFPARMLLVMSMTSEEEERARFEMEIVEALRACVSENYPGGWPALKERIAGLLARIDEWRLCGDAGPGTKRQAAEAARGAK